MQEVQYIVQRAAERDARVVTQRQLVFFSTDAGDAWLLDPEDALALLLARSGEPQPVRIVETETSFAIDWDHQYRMDDRLFTVVNRSGRAATIQGYPMQQIRAAIAQRGTGGQPR